MTRLTPTWFSLLLVPVLCWGQVVLPFLDGGRLLYEAGGGAESDPYWTDPNSYLVAVNMSTNATGNVLDYGTLAMAWTNKPTPATGPTISYYANSQGSNNAVATFDGSDDYLLGEDKAELSFGNGTTDSPFSLSLWIYISNTNAADRIIYKGTPGVPANIEYNFRLASWKPTMFLFANLDGAQYVQRQCSSALPTGQWSHVAMTYNATGGGGIVLWTNGVVAASTASTTGVYVAMNAGTAPLTINALGDGTLVGGSKKLDSIRMSAGVWSGATISNQFLYGNPTNRLVKGSGE